MKERLQLLWMIYWLGHNEIVEEVLRRLEENDLYVKPEKCVWKERKVPFLGVIMGEGKVEGSLHDACEVV